MRIFKKTEEQKMFENQCLNSIFYNFVESSSMDMNDEDRLYNLRGILEELKKDPALCIRMLEDLIDDAEYVARTKGHCPQCGNVLYPANDEYGTDMYCEKCGHYEEDAMAPPYVDYRVVGL